MSYIKVYIHFVWSTENRQSLLATPELRQEVWHHIRNNAVKKDIFVDTINGYKDHCHCLLSLGAKHTLSNIMQLIKGESSYWINKNKQHQWNFEWQDDYYAASVSHRDVPMVREYIRNQETHHQKHTFQEEIDIFLHESGFQRFKDGSIQPMDFRQ